jgi:glycine/D-amino acid oxidase-like deaminating enzyme
MGRLPPAQSHFDTVVVGGGIVGVSLACFLAKEGVQVAIIDAGRAGGTTTNAGSLHVQMQSRFMQVYPDLVAGMESTLHLYPKAVRFWQALEKEIGARFDLKITGGLMVAETREQLDFLAHKAERERTLGVEAEILERAALEEAAPYLGPCIVGAELCRMEGKLNPLLANAALHDWRRRLGVAYLNRTVTRIERDGRAFAIDAVQEPLRAERVVLAAGHGTRLLAAELGVHIPADPEPLHMNITESTAPFIAHLVQHADRPITLKQLGTGQVVIGGGWPAHLAGPNDFPTVELASLIGNATLAQHIVPGIAPLRIMRTWAGVNTSVDGRCVLGEVESVPGLFIAVPGDAGYTLGPLAARLVADAMLGRQPSEDLSAFSPSRFQPAPVSSAARA